MRSATWIFAIVAGRFHAQPRVYHDVIVRLSTDPAFATNVRTVDNNDYDNSSGFGVGRAKAYIDKPRRRVVWRGATEYRGRQSSFRPKPNAL